VLLMGAGMFMRSFIGKQSVNNWIPADRIMTSRLTLPKEKYPDAAARQRFFEKLLSRIAGMPGVTSVASVSDLPAEGSGGRVIGIEGAPLNDPAHGPSAAVVVESPGYLNLIGLPILRGRDFNSTDGDAGHRSVVVTKDFAARHWPRADALGKRFRFYSDNKSGDWMTVIGISANLVQSAMEPSPDPLVFLPYRQDSYDSMAIAVRTRANPSAIVPALRTAVQDLDQDLPLSDVRTLAEEMNRQFWFLQVFGTIFLTFALIAMLLASIGIYAVMAQATGRRTREIGVRIALGATASGIQRLVLKRGIVQLSIGLALGLAAAWPAARILAGLRFLTSPTDPLLVAGVAAVLAGTGLFACWLPARRAAALNPVNAIRNE